MSLLSSVGQVPLSIFRSPVVVATIHFKWHQFAAQAYRNELYIYLVYYAAILVVSVGGIGTVSNFGEEGERQ